MKKRPFSECVSEFLERSKLTQGELALLIGVSRPTINAWSLGKREPFGLVRGLVLNFFRAWRTNEAFRREQFAKLAKGRGR